MQRSLKEVFFLLFNKKSETKQVKLKCLSDVEHTSVNEEEQGLEIFFFPLNHDLTCLNDHFFYQRWDVLQPFSTNRIQKHTKKRSAF